MKNKLGDLKIAAKLPALNKDSLLIFSENNLFINILRMMLERNTRISF